MLDYAVQPEQVAYQPAGGRTLLRDTHARQRGLGHEHQPATRPQQPSRFGIHRYGSHQTDAPYSLITRSAQPAPSGTRSASA